MKITEIIKSINTHLDGERVRYDDVAPYLDAVIDTINSNLQAKYPTFSESNSIPGYNGDYNFFPERYIRSVVVVGTALKYYTQDEEGEQVSSGYYRQFQENLGDMVRDYTNQVPEEFQNNEGGYLDMKPFEVQLWRL